MKKNIIVTSGPTNERLDAVMKITNMSTGALGATIADLFIKESNEQINKLYYISTKLSRKPQANSNKLKLIEITSADDLALKLKLILENEPIYAVIHSSAVGDYKGEYAITADLLAEEIAKKCLHQNLDEKRLKELVLSIIKNPENIVSDKHKISSYEENLIFKLALTPKVISQIKLIQPETKLFGFKLLDGVSYTELIETAKKLRAKNQAEYIIANDLSNIKNGKHLAYFVGENSVDYTCNSKKEIAKTLKKIIF